MNGAALRIDNLGFGYQNALLEGVNLELGSGEMGCLLGRSGAGKSTLLRLIAGLERPACGAVALGGQALFGQGVDVPVHERNVGMLLQDAALFPHLNVAQNVGFALRRQSDAADRIQHWLELVGLADRAYSAPADLSGGERQRVALARTLAAEPKLLLLDEPFSALSTNHRQQLAQEVLLLLRELGVTVLMVTHDWDEAMSHADRVGVLMEGGISQWCAPQELYEQPQRVEIAGFIPDVNLLSAHCDEDGAWVVALGRIDAADARVVQDGGGTNSGWVMVRSDAAQLGPAGEFAVLSRHYLGGIYRYSLRLNDTEMLTVHSSQVYEVGARIGAELVKGPYCCYGADS